MLLLLLMGCGFTNSYNIFVTFDNVEGLNESSEVFANGLEVGEITDMKLVRGGVLVTIRIKDKYKISKNSGFEISNSGLLSKSIKITQGKENVFLNDGDTVKGLHSYNEKRMDLTSEKLDTLVTTLFKAVEYSQSKRKHE